MANTCASLPLCVCLDSRLRNPLAATIATTGPQQSSVGWDRARGWIRSPDFRVRLAEKQPSANWRRPSVFPANTQLMRADFRRLFNDRADWKGGVGVGKRSVAIFGSSKQFNNQKDEQKWVAEERSYIMKPMGGSGGGCEEFTKLDRNGEWLAFRSGYLSNLDEY